MSDPIFPAVNGHTGTCGSEGTDLACNPQGPFIAAGVLFACPSWWEPSRAEVLGKDSVLQRNAASDQLVWGPKFLPHRAEDPRAVLTRC